MTDSTISPDGGSEQGTQTPDERLNAHVAIAVALISAFMAICNTKADSVSAGEQKARDTSVNLWSQYQAKRVRQFMLETAIVEVSTGRAADPSVQTAVDNWKSESARYTTELADLTLAAAEADRTAAAAAVRGDLFSQSNTALTVALTLYAVAALTRRRWLIIVASISALAGIAFGLGGFTGWHALRQPWLMSLVG